MNILLKMLIFFIFSTTILAGESPRIVAFLGQKGVGKDTSGEVLINELNYVHYALADPMKEFLHSHFGLSHAQLWGDEKEIVDPRYDATPREMMQYIGVDVLFYGLGVRFPKIGNNFYLNFLDRKLAEDKSINLVITDLRLQEDIYALKERGALIIKIERKLAVSNDTHVSEAGVANVEGFDRIIENDGTKEDLRRKILEIMQGS